MQYVNLRRWIDPEILFHVVTVLKMEVRLNCRRKEEQQGGFMHLVLVG